jgi:hypothetical protein
MRWIKHILAALAMLLLLLIAAIAFFLYDPLTGGPHWLAPSSLITAPASAAGARPADAEPTIEQTDTPALAALARRYQPTLVTSAFDRNWPVSVVSLLRSRWHGHLTCLFIAGRCAVPGPSVSDISGAGASSDFIQFPSPIDDVQDTFLSAAADLGVVPDELLAWFKHPAKVDPFVSAQVYFYLLPRTTRRSYPGLPPGLISLEYWFYYPLNYFPLVRIPLAGLDDPIASTLGNTDYHQGDLEHVAVLLDPATMRPRYLWMARHADEGQAYGWHSRSVQWSGDHATIYAALGSHASYADCGIQRRSRTYWFINDYVVCIPHKTYGFTYAATPLVDLAKTRWGCWRGHLGEAGRGLFSGVVGFVQYETPGPVSPLLQHENFRTACHVAPGTPKPPAAL